jgi:hypothetical protein
MWDHSLTTALLALSTLPLATYGETHMDHARAATVTLQETWYNGQTGLYNSTAWWNCANAITTLADMSAVDPNVLDRTTNGIFRNTYNQAQKKNLNVYKYDAMHECDGIHHRCPNASPHTYSPKGYLNSYFDDEGWWALAWIAVWDKTKDDAYLNAATFIFDDIVAHATNATCGGIWWNRKHTQVNAIAAELFISVAAHLANRKPNGAYYLKWAKKMYNWFLKSGLINLKGNINDSLDLKTCKNPLNAVWR